MWNFQRENTLPLTLKNQWMDDTENLTQLKREFMMQRTFPRKWPGDSPGERGHTEWEKGQETRRTRQKHSHVLSTLQEQKQQRRQRLRLGRWKTDREEQMRPEQDG
jgi:hypothetical protein